MLKPLSLLPPVIALAIAGIWLGSQHRSISTLEQESAVLQQAIAARSTGTAHDSQHGKPAAPLKTTKDKEPFDWKKIAAQFAETQQSGGMGDMRTMMKFQQRLQALLELHHRPHVAHAAGLAHFRELGGDFFPIERFLVLHGLRRRGRLGGRDTAIRAR